MCAEFNADLHPSGTAGEVDERTFRSLVRQGQRKTRALLDYYFVLTSLFHRILRLYTKTGRLTLDLGIQHQYMRFGLTGASGGRDRNRAAVVRLSSTPLRTPTRQDRHGAL